MREKLLQLWRDEEGATAVEYGLIVAAIAAVIIVFVFALGDKIAGAFDDVDDELAAEGVSSPD